MLMKILSALLVLSLANTCRAQTCEKTLNACEGAYQSQKKLITDQKAQIENYYKKDQLSYQIIQDQQNQLSSPWKDPVKVAAITTIGVIILEIALGVFKK